MTVGVGIHGRPADHPIGVGEFRSSGLGQFPRTLWPGTRFQFAIREKNALEKVDDPPGIASFWFAESEKDHAQFVHFVHQPNSGFTSVIATQSRKMRWAGRDVLVTIHRFGYTSGNL